MKKIIAVLILMAMSLAMIGVQAEVKLVCHGWKRVDDEMKPYVVLESDSGDSVTLFVTQEEQDKYVEECFLKKVTDNDTEERGWFEKAVDWITFWN